MLFNIVGFQITSKHPQRPQIMSENGALSNANLSLFLWKFFTWTTFPFPVWKFMKGKGKNISYGMLVNLLDLRECDKKCYVFCWRSNCSEILSFTSSNVSFYKMWVLVRSLLKSFSKILEVRIIGTIKEMSEFDFRISISFPIFSKIPASP